MKREDDPAVARLSAYEQRTLAALESIAASLEKMASPAYTVDIHSEEKAEPIARQWRCCGATVTEPTKAIREHICRDRAVDPFAGHRTAGKFGPIE